MEDGKIRTRTVRDAAENGVDMAKRDNTEVKELTKKLEEGVKEVFSSDKYKEYLRFLGMFHNYSFNNVMLILMQMPDASLVAGYKTWQKLGRNVKKGEHGIRILAPCPHKRTIEVDGDDKEVCFTTFRPTSVFDVSQTEGDELPQGFVTMLSDDVDGYESLIKKLTAVSPVKVEFEEIEDSSALGFFSHTENKIVVKSGMSQMQTVKTLVHEISHSLLHNKENGEEKEADRRTKEVQAESVAYTVCGVLGIDTSDYSFGYIAGWSKDKDVKELSKSMEVVRKTASKLIEDIKAA